MKRILIILSIVLIANLFADKVSMEIVKKRKGIPNVYINIISKDAKQIAGHIKKMIKRDRS